MAASAQVAVGNAAFHFDKLYTYAVPARLAGRIYTGSMVLVPFGRGAKPRMGVVLEVSDQPPEFCAVKEIFDAAPEEARLTPQLLQLVYYLKEATLCTFYDAVRAVIPYGAQYRPAIEDGRPCLQRQITRMEDKIWRLSGVQGDKKATPKQQNVLDVLATGEKEQADLLETAGVTQAVLKTMEKHGWLVCGKADKKLELYTTAREEGETVLSPAQQNVYEGLRAQMEKETPGTALLHGVTSSGKTLVFLQLLRDVVAKGKTALVLVPEISLTPQMVRRVKAAFGQRVAVQHSALNNTERLLQWRQIQAGEADVVVGTRSAVFAPLENLGLIIIDEEQEHTYRSEQSPRYLAHDVARLRASQEGALLLLASATPSVESYYAAQNGRYTLYELKERFGALPLPAVELVDMRQNLLEGYSGLISAQLGREIAENLNRGEQTILLLNRRGYQTVALCSVCKKVLKCDSCSVPLVYHKAQNKLLCHHCGKTLSPAPRLCPSCGEELRYAGYGTQKIEEELEEKFHGARVLRMDLDTTTKKNAHETMLAAFSRGEYDILLGTQMVAKGLDFEHVTLVGVIGIDSLLFSQGYRAFENVFSLVTQVVGRSGRAGFGGRAVLQTVDVQHPVLKLAARQDYKSFYQEEILFRKLNLYPPFCTLCLACFTAKSEADALAAAGAFSRQLAQLSRQAQAKGVSIPLRILGPSPFHILMVNERYRYKLIIKCREGKTFRALLKKAAEVFSTQPAAARASFYFDFHSDFDL